MAARSNNGATGEGYGRGSAATVIPSWGATAFTYCGWMRVHSTAGIAELMFTTLGSAFQDGITLYYEDTTGSMMLEAASGNVPFDTAQFASRPAVNVDFAFYVTCTGLSGTASAGWRATGSSTWVTVTVDTPATSPNLEFFDFAQVATVYSTHLSLENLKIWTRVLTIAEIDAETRYAGVRFPASLNAHYRLRDITEVADLGPNGYLLFTNGTPENSVISAEVWVNSSLLMGVG